MANYNPNQLRGDDGQWVSFGPAPKRTVKQYIKEETGRRAIHTAHAGIELAGAGLTGYKLYRHYGPTLHGTYNLAQSGITHLPTGVAVVDKALRRKNG